MLILKVTQSVRLDFGLSTIHPDNCASFLTQTPSAYLSRKQHAYSCLDFLVLFLMLMKELSFTHSHHPYRRTILTRERPSRDEWWKRWGLNNDRMNRGGPPGSHRLLSSRHIYSTSPEQRSGPSCTPLVTSLT